LKSFFAAVGILANGNVGVNTQAKSELFTTKPYRFVFEPQKAQKAGYVSFCAFCGSNIVCGK